MSQVLSADRCCREALQKFLARLKKFESQSASGSTSAYCQARKRLKTDYLSRIHDATTARLESLEKPRHLWRGRQVKVVDGSSASMPDTAENQKVYPQTRTQKAGCGFPIMRLAVIFSLATGAILDAAWD